jgi:CopG family transcriptional regulator, nickel-responsive regulator
MRRSTISVDEDLAAQFDDLVYKKGYANRSEAFDDLDREVGR